MYIRTFIAEGEVLENYSIVGIISGELWHVYTYGDNLVFVRTAHTVRRDLKATLYYV